MSNVGRALRQRLNVKPYPFQIRGVRFLDAAGGRAILGDEMGLGKTLQAIGWLVLHPEARPAFIVCPSSVKLLWRRELFRRAGLRASILDGLTPDRAKLKRRDIWIVNYDILYKWRRVLPKIRTLILDECHRIKTREARRTRAAVKLGRKIPHIIAMSGTLLVNQPIELWPVLHLIAPDEFDSFWEFAFRYCDPKQGYAAQWDMRGAENLDELHERLKKLMLRRLTADVMKQLPEKTRVIVPMELDTPAAYDKAERSLTAWVQRQTSQGARSSSLAAPGLSRLNKLKFTAAKLKLPSVVRWIEDFYEDGGGKLVIFAVHHKIIDALLRAFPTAAKVDGRTPIARREKEVQRFQQKRNCRLFIGNIEAAGVGLDGLQHAASTVAFAEFGWTPGEHDQAEFRVLRIGQKAQHITAYYLVAKGTVEEPTLRLIDRKRRICRHVLDGSPGMSSSVQRQLLKRYLKGDTDASQATNYS